VLLNDETVAKMWFIACLNLVSTCVDKYNCHLSNI